MQAPANVGRETFVNFKHTGNLNAKRTLTFWRRIFFKF